jgi:hypothetical protein
VRKRRIIETNDIGYCLAHAAKIQGTACAMPWQMLRAVPCGFVPGL